MGEFSGAPGAAGIASYIKAAQRPADKSGLLVVGYMVLVSITRRSSLSSATNTNGVKI